jgi:hypothetical protein
MLSTPVMAGLVPAIHVCGKTNRRAIPLMPRGRKARRENSACQFSLVMPGLDPGIHAVTAQIVEKANGMDCRVKPGNDEDRR